MFGAKHEELSKGVKYLTPGIHNVTIVDLESTNEAYFVLRLKAAGEEDSTSKDFRFFTSEKALNLNMNKFYEIVEAANPKASSVEAESLDDYLNKVKPLIVGKSYVQKFTGSEFVNQNNETKVRTEIPLSKKTQKNPEPTIAVSLNSTTELSFSDNEIKRIQNESPDEDTPSWED